MSNEQSPFDQSVVSSLEAYKDSIEPRLDPNDLDDAETIDYVLTMMTHPSVGLGAHSAASRALQLLGAPDEDDWTMRAAEISIHTEELDSDEFDKIKGDDVVAALLMLIRAKNGHLAGNEDILAAARVLIDFRVGVIMKRRELEDLYPDKWRKLLVNLSRATH